MGYTTKKNGRFWIENELIDNHLHGITGNDLKVLLKITRHYNKNGKCFPSIRKMVEPLNLNPETISKSLKNLEKQGFFEILEIKERKKLRYFFSKTALFLMPKTPEVLQKTSSKEALKEDYEGIDIKLKEKNYKLSKRTEKEQIRMNSKLTILKDIVYKKTENATRK